MIRAALAAVPEFAHRLAADVDGDGHADVLSPCGPCDAITVAFNDLLRD